MGKDGDQAGIKEIVSLTGSRCNSPEEPGGDGSPRHSGLPDMTKLTAKSTAPMNELRGNLPEHAYEPSACVHTFWRSNALIGQTCARLEQFALAALSHRYVIPRPSRKDSAASCRLPECPAKISKRWSQETPCPAQPSGSL
jgi:hypothetical protein